MAESEAVAASGAEESKSNPPVDSAVVSKNAHHAIQVDDTDAAATAAVAWAMSYAEMSEVKNGHLTDSTPYSPGIETTELAQVELSAPAGVKITSQTLSANKKGKALGKEILTEMGMLNEAEELLPVDELGKSPFVEVHTGNTANCRKFCLGVASLVNQRFLIAHITEILGKTKAAEEKKRLNDIRARLKREESLTAEEMKQFDDFRPLSIAADSLENHFPQLKNLGEKKAAELVWLCLQNFDKDPRTGSPCFGGDGVVGLRTISPYLSGLIKDGVLVQQFLLMFNNCDKGLSTPSVFVGSLPKEVILEGGLIFELRHGKDGKQCLVPRIKYPSKNLQQSQAEGLIVTLKWIPGQGYVLSAVMSAPAMNFHFLMVQAEGRGLGTKGSGFAADDLQDDLDAEVAARNANSRLLVAIKALRGMKKEEKLWIDSIEAKVNYCFAKSNKERAEKRLRLKLKL